MQEITRFLVGKQEVGKHEGILSMPLYKGMKVCLQTQSDPLTVYDWFYSQNETANEATLTILLSDKKNISARQEEFNIVGAVLTAFLFVIVIFLSITQPTIVKGLLGAALQPLVGFGTWMLMIAVGIYAENRLQDKPKLGNYLRWVFAFVGVIAAFTLAVQIAPGNKLVQFPADYANYYEESVKSLAVGWKILAAILGIPLGIWAFLSKSKSNLDKVLEGFGAKKSRYP